MWCVLIIQLWLVWLPGGSVPTLTPLFQLHCDSITWDSSLLPLQVKQGWARQGEGRGKKGSKVRERHWPGNLRVAGTLRLPQRCPEVTNYVAEACSWKNRACGCHLGAWHTAVMVDACTIAHCLLYSQAYHFYKESDLLKATER